MPCIEQATQSYSIQAVRPAENASGQPFALTADAPTFIPFESSNTTYTNYLKNLRSLQASGTPVFLSRRETCKAKQIEII